MSFSANVLVWDNNTKQYEWKEYTIYDELLPSEYKEEESDDVDFSEYFYPKAGGKQ